MKTLRFQGYSDDILCECGVTNMEVDNNASGKPIQCEISSNGNKMVIVGLCDKSVTKGCWVIGVCNADQESPIPNWNVRIRQSCRTYSPLIEVDVPDDFELNWYIDGVCKNQ